MTVAAKTWTADEFSRISDEPNRHELIRGEVVTMPPPNAEHGFLAGTILIHLGGHVTRNRLGVAFAAETGFLLERDPDTVRAPDVAFVRRSRVPTGRPGKEYIAGSPDFVAEVLSPSDTVFGTDEKVQAWLAGGAKLVWVVNPRQESVMVYRPGQPPAMFLKGQTLDAGDVVEGFTLSVAAIFGED